MRKNISEHDKFISQKQEGTNIEFVAHSHGFWHLEGQIEDEYIDDTGKFCFEWVEFIAFEIEWNKLTDKIYAISHNDSSEKIFIDECIEEHRAHEIRNSVKGLDYDTQPILCRIINCGGKIKQIMICDFHRFNGADIDVTHCIDEATYAALESLTYHDVLKLTPWVLDDYDNSAL
tara:strand:+ start:8524 stop:9048 length:525 start_codon:yes stop_codon:yes gene_type:complete